MILTLNINDLNIIHTGLEIILSYARESVSNCRPGDCEFKEAMSVIKTCSSVNVKINAFISEGIMDVQFESNDLELQAMYDALSLLIENDSNTLSNISAKKHNYKSVLKGFNQVNSTFNKLKSYMEEIEL